MMLLIAFYYFLKRFYLGNYLHKRPFVIQFLQSCQTRRDPALSYMLLQKSVKNKPCENIFVCCSPHFWTAKSNSSLFKGLPAKLNPTSGLLPIKNLFPIYTLPVPSKKQNSTTINKIIEHFYR